MSSDFEISFSHKGLELHIKNNLLQGLAGRSQIFFVSSNPPNKRSIFQADLPKKSGVIKLKDPENPMRYFNANYSGNLWGGRLSIDKENFPKTGKFYLELGQTFGPFIETDYFSTHKEKKRYCQEKVIAIMPCYNVKAFCYDVVSQTLKYVSKLILIDDGSNDGTKEILKKLAGQHSEQIILLDHKKNKGKGFCLLEGFKHALKHTNFKVLVTLDSDFQHLPKDIPRLAEAIEEEEDFAIGSRTFKQMPLRSRLANIFITIFLRSMYPHAPKDTQSGYRAFNHKMVEEFVRVIEGGQYEMEFKCLMHALSNHKRIRALPISTIYIDGNSSSKFNPIKDSGKVLKVLLSMRKTKKISNQ